MKRFLTSACAAVTAFSLLAGNAMATTIADYYHWKPVFVTPAHPQPIDPVLLQRMADAGATLPFWRSSVKSALDGKTYNFEMIGTSPLKTAASTTISYVPIVLKVKLPDGNTLDPTKPGCGDTKSVESRFFDSPLFESVTVKSNGISMGTTQITDAFQRANFWETIKGSSKYHVLLKSALSSPIVVTLKASSATQLYAGVCSGGSHEIAAIDINTYDAYIQTLVNKYAKPNQLPLVLSYNVFETSGGSCCILGYHNAYTRSTGEQTYSVGAYNDAGIFSVPIEDIHAWSHEIGEWMDDPYVQTDGYNYTPAWGNIGQVSGCQNNLEVGDPLTGTPYEIKYNGFTYHPQELTFFSWFYRISATGTDGKFSFEGTFKKAQGKCS